MTNINDVIANELVRRVRKLSTDELLALAKNSVAERRGRRSGLYRLALPKVVSGGRPTLTIAEAILKATGGGVKLGTAEIVAGTKAIRPDAQEATIRAEISKLTANGVLLRHGPRIGGTYEAVPGLAKTG